MTSFFAGFPDDILCLIAEAVRNSPGVATVHSLLNFVNSNARTFRLFHRFHSVWGFRDDPSTTSRKRLNFLLYTKGCERCERINVTNIFLPFDIRLCENCYNETTIRRDTLAALGVPPKAYDGVPCHRTARREIYLKKDLDLDAYGVYFGRQYVFLNDHSFAKIFFSDVLTKKPEPPRRCSCPSNPDFCMTHRKNLKTYSARFGKRRCLVPAFRNRYITYRRYMYPSPGYTRMSPVYEPVSPPASEAESLGPPTDTDEPTEPAPAP